MAGKSWGEVNRERKVRRCTQESINNDGENEGQLDRENVKWIKKRREKERERDTLSERWSEQRRK